MCMQFFFTFTQKVEGVHNCTLLSQAHYINDPNFLPQNNRADANRRETWAQV